LAGFQVIIIGRFWLITEGCRSLACVRPPGDNRDIKMTTVYTCRVEKAIGAGRGEG